MLVLSRKVGERIVIGDNITVTIQKINGNRVAVGIQAPGEVGIMRGELAQHAKPAPPATEPTAYNCFVCETTEA